MRIHAAHSLRALGALALLSFLPAHALQGGAVQPDYLQFEPADAPDMVNLLTGDFTYNLPLGEVPGPYGSFPLSMSYHAGIGPNQEASWVGLGWTLNPGAINRNLRGAPDDQFHGGELSYIYSWGTSSNWGVYTGYSYGAFSVNQSYSSNEGYGISVGLGIQLGKFVNLGVSFNSDNLLSLDASVGPEKGHSGIGIQGSITFGPDGYEGASSSIMAKGVTGDGGTATASIGVHQASGRKTAADVGFGYNPDLSSGQREGSHGDPNREYSGIHFSDGNVSIRGFGYGTSVSLPGSSINVSSSNGAVENRHDWTGVNLVVPTPWGTFSAGYNRSIDQSWQRQATSEYLSGYMYQAGPAVFTDAKTDEMIIPSRPGGGGTDPNGWHWNYKGRSLDRVGNPVSGDLLPAYDLYNVSANGISGTFRPYALSRHSLFESVDLLESGDPQPQSQYFLLNEDANGAQTADEFPSTPAMTKYAYDYCYDEATKAASYDASTDLASKLDEVIQGRCSRYAVLKSSYLNESNRMVLSSDPYSSKYVRSRMVFRFMGENGGYFSSEDPNRGGNGKFGQYDLDNSLFQKTVNGVNYGLFGARRIDPILENGLNNGRLQGFKITNPDGTQFFFTQPVRAILSADYTTNQAKGVPLFIDKSSPGASDHFWNVIGNAFKTLWHMKINWKEIVNDNLFWALTGLEYFQAKWTFNTVASFFWSSPNFKDKCQEGAPDSQSNYSYSVKMNPYATQWLLTEVRGPEFVELDKQDMTKNIGYQVKLNYTPPVWYKWRFPFAPPNTNWLDLPNFRMPKNALTPEDCHSDLYNASFGVKELVYLKSIETATHRADFNLNDPLDVNDARIDGKGWIQDWTGRTQHMSDPKHKSTAMPLYMDAEIEASQVPLSGQSWSADPVCNAEMSTDPDGSPIRTGTTCWWERKVNFSFDGAYLNVMPTPEQISRMADGTHQVSIGGVIGGSEDIYRGPDGSRSYPTGSVFPDGDGTVQYPNGDPPTIASFAPAHGDKLALGSSFVRFTQTVNYPGTYRYGMSSASCSAGDSPCPMPTMVARPTNDDMIKPTIILGGKGGFANLQPLLVYNDFVEPDGAMDNQMRYLKSVRISEKASGTALRQFEMSYANDIAPGTLNSYPAKPGTDPNHPDHLDLIGGYPTDPSLAGLQGKLKLKSVREVACLSSDCSSKVPMPPFQFFYKDEHASSLKLVVKPDGDPDAGKPDYYGTIIASSNPQDEWGFWNLHATEDNHKVRQDFADKGGVTWSMDKVVDPAGGQLEISYERDRYKGESYADDTKGYPISWRKCPDGAIDGLGRDPTHLCIDVLPRRWQTYCNRADQLEGEYVYNPNTPPTNADYDYLQGMNTLGDQQSTAYFELDGTYGAIIGCGSGLGKWKWNDCRRTREVGLLGSGKIVKIVHDTKGTPVPYLDAVVNDLRSIEFDLPYDMIDAEMRKTGYKLMNRDFHSSLDPQKGLLWLQKKREDIKGGDIRVTKLVKRDIGGLVQTTRYDYAPGEMAQYPDSVLSTAFAERYSPAKAISVLPLTYLPGVSRIPGINDAEAAFLPPPVVTYPKVTVTNISSTGDQIYNGKTVHEFITPETGVPLREGGVDPFLKVTLQVYSPDLAPINGDAYLRFKDANGFSIGSQVQMTHLPAPHNNTFVFESSDPAAPYKNAHTVEVSYGINYILFLPVSLPDPADVFKEYAEVSLTGYTIGTSGFTVQLSDYKGSHFTPILVRTTPAWSPSTAYSDYTAFMGRDKNTEFYRWIPSGPGDVNNPGSQDPSKYRLIRGDTTIYSAVAPSADTRFYSGAQARKSLIGRDEEKWEYTRKVHCKDASGTLLPPVQTGPDCAFDTKGSGWDEYAGVEATVARDADGKPTAFVPKQMSYVRNPVFIVESISKTGFNGSSGSDDYVVSRVTNHKFDPVTGQPTLSVSFTGRSGQPVQPGQAAPAKATRGTPAYIVDAPLASTMFERNILASLFREDVYTWDVAPTADNTVGGTAVDFDAEDPSTSPVFPPRLTGVKLTPYMQGDRVSNPGFPDYSGPSEAPRPIAPRDNPILGIGSFTPRFPLTTASGQQNLANNALFFSPTFLSDGNFLRLWSGKRIVSVNDWFKPKEERDVYDYSLAHRYDPAGFHEIGLFGNAAYAETAILTAEGRVNNMPDVSVSDGWRFTDVTPVVEDPYIRLGGDFTLSHALNIAPSGTYLVEAQFSSNLPENCLVQFYSDDGAVGDSKSWDVKTGLNTYQAVLDASKYASIPAKNRVRLTCLGGAHSTVRLSYLRAYPEKGEALSYIYDARGRMVQAVNEQNVSSYFEYDAFGNLIAKRNDDGVLYSTHKRELVNVAAP